MNLYEHIFNQEERAITVRLYGTIGSEVDGNSLAHSIAEWGESPDIDVIRLRINSGGGSVIDGMSIVSAIRSSRAVVHGYVDGIAASMAAVIAVSTDKLYMMDYAKLMIHDPYLAGVGQPSEKEKKALASITDMLRSILSGRGIELEEIARLMKEETWFSAEEAKEKHLADEVITSKRKDELAGLSTTELAARIQNEYKPQIKTSMNEIAKFLGLPENATEQQILDKIKQERQEATDLRTRVIDSQLAEGEKNGTVTDKNKLLMRRLADTDLELFLQLVGEKHEPEAPAEPALTKPQGAQPRLSEAIARLGKQEPGGKAPASQSGKDWDWYQRHNPGYLSRLEKENPEEFKRMLDEYEANL